MYVCCISPVRMRLLTSIVVRYTVNLRSQNKKINQLQEIMKEIDKALQLLCYEVGGNFYS